MAISATDKITLCQILQVTPTVLDAQLSWLGTNLTATMETAIGVQIALWSDGAGTKTTKIHAKESNRGVETNPTMARADIRRNIAVLLERPEWGNAGSFLQRS